MKKYKIRDDNGVVIGQFVRHDAPKQPDNYNGGWNVEIVDELNDEKVDWWFES